MANQAFAADVPDVDIPSIRIPDDIVKSLEQAPQPGSFEGRGISGMDVLKAWLQNHYNTWTGKAAGPGLDADWKAAIDKFGKDKVTRRQVESARDKVKRPKSFQPHKRGPKPKGN